MTRINKQPALLQNAPRPLHRKTKLLCSLDVGKLIPQRHETTHQKVIRRTRQALHNLVPVLHVQFRLRPLQRLEVSILCDFEFGELRLVMSNDIRVAGVVVFNDPLSRPNACCDSCSRQTQSDIHSHDTPCPAPT